MWAQKRFKFFDASRCNRPRDDREKGDRLYRIRDTVSSAPKYCRTALQIPQLISTINFSLRVLVSSFQVLYLYDNVESSLAILSITPMLINYFLPFLSHYRNAAAVRSTRVRIWSVQFIRGSYARDDRIEEVTVRGFIMVDTSIHLTRSNSN